MKGYKTSFFWDLPSSEGSFDLTHTSWCRSRCGLNELLMEKVLVWSGACSKCCLIWNTGCAVTVHVLIKQSLISVPPRSHLRLRDLQRCMRPHCTISYCNTKLFAWFQCHYRPWSFVHPELWYTLPSCLLLRHNCGMLVLLFNTFAISNVLTLRHCLSHCHSDLSSYCSLLPL